MDQSGKLEVIYGPMFSGKTTSLLAKFERWVIAKKKCMLVTSKRDNRYSEEQVIVTHSGVQYNAKKLEKLSELEDIKGDYQVFGIDEGQFFDDLVEACESLAQSGKIVIVATLDGTFERKPFGRVCELVPLAETVTKLQAVCAFCYENASFSVKIAGTTDIVEVGGSDMYKPACRGCYYKNTANKGTDLTKKTLGLTKKTLGLQNEDTTNSSNIIFEETFKVLNKTYGSKST